MSNVLSQIVILSQRKARIERHGFYRPTPFEVEAIETIKRVFEWYETQENHFPNPPDQDALNEYQESIDPELAWETEVIRSPKKKGE
jgi:hypothetical protein